MLATGFIQYVCHNGRFIVRQHGFISCCAFQIVCQIIKAFFLTIITVMTTVTEVSTVVAIITG